MFGRAQSLEPQTAAQLVSLLRWGIWPVASSVRNLTGSSAGVAQDKSPLVYAKERKAHQVELSELRKRWAQEHTERRSKAESEAEAARQRRAARMAQRAQQDKAAAEAKRQALADQQAAERLSRAKAKEERLKRAELRDVVLGLARQDREALLLQQSRRWVAPDALDQRITEALDNPLPLHPLASSGRAR